MAIIEIVNFLSEDNKRTELNELIARLRKEDSSIFNDKLFKSIDTDLELVNNGFKNWIWLYNKYSKILTTEYITNYLNNTPTIKIQEDN